MPQDFFMAIPRMKSLDICGQYGSILAGHVIEIVGARMDHEKWGKIRTTCI